MAAKKATDETMATLALAKAMADGDSKAADAAMKAGANPEAFWIDGSTRLRELVGRWGTATATKAMAALFTPGAMQAVPSLRSDRSFWSSELAEFAARRGARFYGRTTPVSRVEPGTEPDVLPLPLISPRRLGA